MVVRFFVKIGRKEGVVGWDEERIHIVVDAPPVKGAANKRLIEIICKFFGVSKSQINIKNGLTSRRKTLDIFMDQNEFDIKINNLPKIFKQERLL